MLYEKPLGILLDLCFAFIVGIIFRSFVIFLLMSVCQNFLLLSSLMLATALAAGRQISFSLGDATNFDSDLDIYLNNKKTSHRASYTMPKDEGSIYYDIQYRPHGMGGGIDYELHHHKIKLTNPTSEITYFAMMNGYNLISINYGKPLPIIKRYPSIRTLGRLGAGIVLAYPFSTINGDTFSHQGSLCIPGRCGYFVSGLATQASLLANWHPRPTSCFGLQTEVKYTAARAIVPVARGHADVPNYAWHPLVGLTYGKP